MRRTIRGHGRHRSAIGGDNNPIVQQSGGDDQRLAVMELGEADRLLTGASDPSCRRHSKVSRAPQRRQFGSPAGCSSEEPKSTEAEREQ